VISPIKTGPIFRIGICLVFLMIAACAPRGMAPSPPPPAATTDTALQVQSEGDHLVRVAFPPPLHLEGKLIESAMLFKRALLVFSFEFRQCLRLCVRTFEHPADCRVD